jgi:hypothetical protein
MGKGRELGKRRDGRGENGREEGRKGIGMENVSPTF